MAVHDAEIADPKPATPGRRFFTVEEANDALPYVSRVIDDVTKTYGRIVELRRQLEIDEPTDGAAHLEQGYDAAMDRLGDLIDELHDAGVELKDFEKGLIDFPAMHEGREVLLCWQRGEPHVAHWHEIDAGFAGRQPVNQLLDSDAVSDGE